MSSFSKKFEKKPLYTLHWVVFCVRKLAQKKLPCIMSYWMLDFFLLTSNEKTHFSPIEVWWGSGGMIFLCEAASVLAASYHQHATTQYHDNLIHKVYKVCPKRKPWFLHFLKTWTYRTLKNLCVL
jgi:hypothetical protein